MAYTPSLYNYFIKINPKYTILNNTLTGALDIIDSNFWDLFIKKKYQNIPIKITQLLIDRGYLYTNPEKEKYILRKLFKEFLKKTKENKKRYVICPTYDCNLSCIYCFENNIANKSLSFNDILLKNAFKTIEKISNNNIEHIELYGGEPILNKTKDLVLKTLKFAQKHNSKITIVTNGTNINLILPELISLKENIEMLQVTIDGIKKIHDNRRIYKSGKGSFTEIVENVNRLLLNGVNTNIRINIDNTNVNGLLDLYSFLLHSGWINFSNFDTKLSLVTDHSSSNYNNIIIPEEKMLEKIIRIYKKYPDMEKLFNFYAFKGLRNLIYILNGEKNVAPRFFNCESNLLELHILCPDGYIYSCPESIGIKKYAIGSFYPKFEIFDTRLDMWRNKTILGIEKCKSCCFSPICGGGCTYSSLLISNGKAPACERYSEVLDTFFKYKGEEIIKEFIN
jgi:uncharacterized protein